MELFLFIGIGIVIFFILLFIIFLITGTTSKGLEKQMTKYGNIAVKAKNNIINNNEEELRNIANKTADINKEAIKNVAYSIKKGFSEDEIVYYKHCGLSIDADSKFCKKCGKEQ